MAYSTLDDMKLLQPESVLLQLTDDDNDEEFVTVAGSENRAYLNLLSAIAEADAVIDSYLSGRYDVPVAAPVPDIVKQISRNLALCNLYERRRELELPEGIKERRKRYIEHLRDIKAEKANIVELTKVTPSAFSINKTATDRIFNSDLLDRM